MAIALAFILPMANYAKGLDFKDRPAFLRRIEEKLAALFSGIFVAKEQVKQIDYGQNINHEPVAPPKPPQVGAKKQQSKPNFSRGPRILKQVWLADTKPNADALIATESTSLLNFQPLLAIKENDVDTNQLEIEQVDAQPEPTAETNPSNEQAQFATQESQVDAQEPVEVIVQPELVALKPEEEELVQQVKTATQTVANDLASGLVQPATQVAQSTPVEPEPPMLENTSGSEPSIQAQLAAQQTIAQLEAYALQKQAEQEAKDLLEQQLLQTLQEQVQQQQALAETKRLQEEQRLWVQAEEEASRIMAEQKQILEAELQRQQALLQAEAEFKAKVIGTDEKTDVAVITFAP